MGLVAISLKCSQQFCTESFLEMGIENGSGTHIVKITRQGWEPLTKMVYGVEPDLTLTLQEASGKNVLLLPIGASDDGAHSS